MTALGVSRLSAAQYCKRKIGPILPLTSLFVRIHKQNFQNKGFSPSTKSIFILFYKSSTATTVHCLFTARATASEILVLQTQTLKAKPCAIRASPSSLSITFQRNDNSENLEKKSCY